MKMEELFRHTFRALTEEIRQHRDPRPMWQRRLGSTSVFCQAVVGCGYLTASQMQRAVERYRLGVSRDGGVIFWQIDEDGYLLDGKIMYYRSDCHRDHDRKPTWTSYLLKASGQAPNDWKPEHCLFGLHLLSEERSVKGEEGIARRPEGESQSRTVAVVESEKTAVIMSEVKPDYLWLATGGKTELNVAKLKPLQHHKVILFPDTDLDGSTYRDWFDVAEAASDVYGHPFTVSSLLEQHATKAQKAAKIDIVDYVFNH